MSLLRTYLPVLVVAVAVLPACLEAEAFTGCFRFTRNCYVPRDCVVIEYPAAVQKHSPVQKYSPEQKYPVQKTPHQKPPVVRNPVLEIEQSCPEKRYVGTNVKYVVTVRNSGDAPARNVMLKHEVCRGLSFVQATDDGVLEGNYVHWNLGDLEPGGSKTVTVIHKAETIRKTNCEAIVTSESLEAGTVTSESCAVDIIGIPAILLEVVDVVDPIEVGEVETYKITVTNQGSTPAANIVIKATLPDQLQYVSGEGPTKSSADGQIVTFEPLATLDPKKKTVFKLNVKAVAVGDIRFRLDLTTDQSPEPVSETESTNIYE